MRKKLKARTCPKHRTAFICPKSSNTTRSTPVLVTGEQMYFALPTAVWRGVEDWVPETKPYGPGMSPAGP